MAVRCFHQMLCFAQYALPFTRPKPRVDWLASS
jgi:hypothetical protein